MSSILIESGIEIPPKRETKATDFPFDKLEIGQSFFSNYPNTAALVTFYKYRNPGKNFVTRFYPDGTRVWRTA